MQGPNTKLKCRERVGFASLPDQLVSHERSRGFSFNVMLVGACCCLVCVALLLSG